MSLDDKQALLLQPFIPKTILCSKNNGKSYVLDVYENESYFTLGYVVDSHNQTGRIVGKRTFVLVLPNSVRKTVNTFEVLGLLQAEMGKKQDGKVTFCNHEVPIINKVIRWFNDELIFPPRRWKWYIKLYIKEPTDSAYKKELEQKVISYWVAQTGLLFEQSYPKSVCYSPPSPHTKLKDADFGTLTIERRSNLFSQIVKCLVRGITENILSYTDEEIRGFMRGIIAGEGCIEIGRKFKNYRVQISAIKEGERRIYLRALKKLGIDSHNYACSNAVMVSKRQNHVELFKQGLLTLSPEKYQQFLTLLRQYPQLPLAL